MEVQRMQARCKPDKADAVREALEKAGAKLIEKLTSESGEIVFLCVGTMLMMVSAMGAGADFAGPA